jgi:hypothetical protein
MNHPDPTKTDRGYTVERCKSGLGAAQALAAGQGRDDSPEERYWKAQLAFAEARERHG